MQTITVDMTPGFRQPTIHYSQNDVGTTFAIDLRSRFGDTLPASPTVKIQATKPSGFGFSIEADSVVDSVATFTTVATMTDEAGRFPAELEVSDSGMVLYTANFYMEGEANPHPIGTTDGSQETIIPTLTLLVERVEAAASSVLDMTVEAETLAAGSQATYSYDEDTNTATFGIPQGEAGAGAAGVTASAYSSSKTYAVGDYVIHNSNLYRCTTAITTAEAFTAAHWTQVVLGDDVSDLKAELSIINSTSPVSVTSKITITGGIRADGTDGNTPSFNPYVRSDYIPVLKGMKIKYDNLYGTTGISVLAMYDAGKSTVSVVAGEGPSLGYEASGEITVAQDGFFRVSTLASPPKSAICTVQNVFVKKMYNLVSFGDSYTAGRIIGGSSDYDEANSYPEVFGRLFNYNVTNEAIGGQGFVNGTTEDKAYDTVVDNEAAIVSADLITLKWGNNDPSAPIGDIGTSETILYELNRIINYIRTKNSHCQIIVLSPNNVSSYGSPESRYWYDYLASGWSLSDYNNVIGNYCHSIGIKYIDINGWCAVSNLSDCLGDGVHPKAEALGVYSNYVAWCISETLNTDNNQHDIKVISDCIGKPIDLGAFTDNSFINRSDGAVSTDSTTYRSSGFIPVIGGFGIEFNDVFQRGNCCVAQYRLDKSFISAFYNEATYISSFRATLHNDAAYIRVTGRKSPYPTPTAKYYNYAGDVAKHNFNQDSVIISPTIVGSGALLSNGKTVATDGAISYTDYIPVEPFDVVQVSKVYPTANSGVFMFDEDKNLVGRVRALADGNTTDFAMLIPDDVYCIRYNVTNANASSTTVTRIKITPETDASKQIKNIAGMSGLYKPFSRLKAKHKPLITIIDDDTVSLATVQKFHDACVASGIKGTYAVITDNMVNTSGMKDLLLTYEAEGFQMVTHCMEQLTYMREDSTPEQQALVRTNMVTAQRAMQDAGFLNFRYWVTPYGRHSAFYQKLAKELGFKCLVSLPQLVYEGYTPLEGRWFIPRMELYPDDISGNQTLHDIKDQIDQCVATNGWLLVATHFYENAWDSETITARFSEMVDYALDAGMEHVTLAEGFDYWRSIYDFYEMFD